MYPKASKQYRLSCVSDQIHENTYLAPSGGAKTNGEHRKQPCMRLAEVSEYSQQRSPDADKEDGDQQCDLPLGNWHGPKEAPVTTVRLKQTTFRISENINKACGTYPRKPVITQNLRCKEPEHELPTEERLDETRNLWRSLAVILCMRLSTHGVCTVQKSNLPGRPYSIK